VSAAEIAIAQAADQTLKSEQEAALAKVTLARWIGRQVDTVAADVLPMTSHVARMEREALEQVHPAIRAARAAIAVADADTAVARTERRPDWTVEAGFAQRPHYSNMVSFGVSIPLPVHRSARQDRDVSERAALGTRARLLYEETVRDTRADLLSLSTALDSLSARLAKFKATALPAAGQQAALAVADYRAGTGSLTAVFGARKMQVETQLRALELEKEAALTWAQLEYHVLPHEMASSGGSQP
jgi:outer membrane protein TolC